jgi:hypothetical protein
MLYYRDIQFCSFYMQCKTGKECDRALTEEVKQSAKEAGLGITQGGRPDCFELRNFKEEAENECVER